MLILLRHGETEFNRAGRWQGQIDSPLTDTGRTQAFTAAKRLAGFRFDAIISSPLGRAAETANIVAESLDLAVRTDPRLMEVSSGVLEGLTSEEIEQRWPGFIAWRAQDRWTRAPEGGETYDAAARRLLAFAAEEDLYGYMTSGEPALLIVGHSRSHAILAGMLLGWPKQRSIDTYPPNATPLCVGNGDLTPI